MASATRFNMIDDIIFPIFNGRHVLADLMHRDDSDFILIDSFPGSRLLAFLCSAAAGRSGVPRPVDSTTASSFPGPLGIRSISWSWLPGRWLYFLVPSLGSNSISWRFGSRLIGGISWPLAPAHWISWYFPAAHCQSF